jgi:hypothetical protein
MYVRAQPPKELPKEFNYGAAYYYSENDIENKEKTKTYFLPCMPALTEWVPISLSTI